MNTRDARKQTSPRAPLQNTTISLSLLINPESLMTVSVTIFHHCCNGDKHHRMIQSTAVHLLSVSSVLARQTTISSLKITDRSFRYASPRLWNQLPDSLHHDHHHFRQPSQSCLDSPPHSLVNSSLSLSPLSSSITSSLFHSRLKTYLFNKSLPP